MINSAEFVAVNGFSVTLADDVIPFETVDISRDIRISEVARAQEHGIWPARAYLGKMVITLTGDILGNTSVDYNTARAALMQAFYPYEIGASNYLGTLYLALEGYSERLSCQCTLETNPDFPLAALSPSAGKYNIGLKAFDPRFYGETVHSVSSASALETITGRTYPKTYPVTYGYTGFPAGSQIVTNNGNAETAPIISIYGPGVNPRISITIGATTYVLSLLITLAVGDILVIDLGSRTAILNGVTNVYNLVSGSYWKLPPGDASFTYTSNLGTTTPASHAVLNWQNAYVY